MKPERSVVQFGRTAIPYQIVRGRRQKTVAITIDPAAGVLLRAPAETPAVRLDEIVHGKAMWILERLRKLRDLPPPPGPRQFVSGETFWVRGRQVRLRVEDGGGKAEACREEGWLRVTVPGETPADARPRVVRQALVAWYRAEAEAGLPGAVKKWSSRLGLQPAGVLIRSQQARWASCDPAGVLRFNWRIHQAPARLVDYVVVHELVHLVHPDHTPAFWAALGRALPDYEARRDALRKVGARWVW